MKQDADFKLVYQHDVEINYDGCGILCSSDAAFANAGRDGEKIKSQAGYALGVRAKDGDFA